MIVLTIDTDWAPDWATKVVLDRVRSLGIKTTVFFSTPSPVPLWPELESGCHPDLSKKNLLKTDLAENQEMESGSEARILSEYHQAFPEAEALRTHRFYWHSDLSRQLVKNGFTIDSSMILPYHPHLQGFKVGRLRRFPVWASDHLHLARGHPCDRLELPNINEEGLKIFCFHVAYMYLNTCSLTGFNMIKEGLETEDDRLRNKQTPGIMTLFELLAEKVYKQSQGLWLRELPVQI